MTLSLRVTTEPKKSIYVWICLHCVFSFFITSIKKHSDQSTLGHSGAPENILFFLDPPGPGELWEAVQILSIMYSTEQFILYYLAASNSSTQKKGHSSPLFLYLTKLFVRKVGYQFIPHPIEQLIMTKFLTLNSNFWFVFCHTVLTFPEFHTNHKLCNFFGLFFFHSTKCVIHPNCCVYTTTACRYVCIYKYKYIYSSVLFAVEFPPKACYYHLCWWQLYPSSCSSQNLDSFFSFNPTSSLDFSGRPVVKTLCFHCRGMGSIPAQGTKIPHAMWHSKRNKEKNFFLNKISLALPFFFFIFLFFCSEKT